FGRLTGNETGSVGGAPTAGSRWGVTGLLRMFGSAFGGQVSWLIPAAVILLVAGLAMTRRAVRTDRTRAALILWGGWLGITGLVLSLGQGIIHPYYSVALAPAIGALIAIGGAALWARRDRWVARTVIGAAVAVSGVWAYELLRRSPTWYPMVKDVVLVASLAVAVVLVAW